MAPPKIHQKTRDTINQISNVNPQDQFIPVEHLLPCLQIYQTFFPGVWPVVSVAQLISVLMNKSYTTMDTLSAYSLSCAISAAVIVQVSFLKNKNHLFPISDTIKSLDFVSQSVKARDMFNYRSHPSLDTLLTSFFLYVYYVNTESGTPAALNYLRESISTAQILGLHNPSTYTNKSPAEVHRMRKIYYLLLVTERFTAIEDCLPVILEPSIPLPSLEDEEYPILISGFRELVKIFAIPDKSFFDRFISLNTNASSLPSSSWIVNVQQQLGNIKIMENAPDIQKLNIIISKYWMKSLTWKLAQKNNLLDEMEPSLSIKFPFAIANDFLDETKDLPISSYESNGPGVCVKLLAMVDTLVDAINTSQDNTGLTSLHGVISLLVQLKNDISLPIHEYNKIINMSNNLSTNAFATVPRNEGYISELGSDDSSERSEHDDINQPSPFTQMTMAFWMGPTGTTPLEVPAPVPVQIQVPFSENSLSDLYNQLYS
ncbi:putative zinc finger protein Suc1 [Spathaspora passalidarum NRRL Y-27907]|uniref:Putative zinc finger protein Suc1 n=1 Tax=Spathaspora passalidarum (strain NRRL Y-27907 / 11-Y1) TaxID=619300 RepID=G3AJY5_SPAPN|nr:putative zinc finger protein Suc1 [Spathaspora passalidarum NRRL Y-27907]EGW34036.1 putative zinc finger protein Suc1 [Spathaspora passalidarum NRRL Y-27907]